MPRRRSLVEYTGYLDDVRGGWVGDIQFTLEDFKAHNRRLEQVWVRSLPIELLLEGLFDLLSLVEFLSLFLDAEIGLESL